MSPELAALLREFGLSEALLAERKLCQFAEAEVLVEAEVGVDGRSHMLVPEAAEAWQAMKAAAADEGITLQLVSAFRSIARQAEVLRRKLARGESIVDVLRVCAPPGYSEHHTGRAVDVATPGAAILDAAFADSAAFAWLQAHADVYGFCLSFPQGNALGYAYEPWHWCYRGAAGEGCA